MTTQYTRTSANTDLWDQPSYEDTAGPRYEFNATNHARFAPDELEIRVMHRNPAFNLISIDLNARCGFISPDDAERFASALLTVTRKAREHIAQTAKARALTHQIPVDQGALF